MAAEVNQFGLSRDIPANVKRVVRQDCGFGCVICGASIVEYEHVDPEFHEARSHASNAIALLCSACHGNVTRKFWSKEKVKVARSAPHCKQAGFSWGELDIGRDPPIVRFAGVTFRRTRIPIAVHGIPLLRIDEPEGENAPFRLSANFVGPNGELLLQINQNEWRATSDIWDVEFKGGRIVVRDKAQSQCLIVRADPPRGIVVEKLEMKVGNFVLSGDADTLKVDSPTMAGEFSNVGMDGAQVGISLG